jgi:hypothetical protein
LTVSITVFLGGNGEYGIMPSAEDPVTIIHEFDPFQP